MTNITSLTAEIHSTKVNHRWYVDKRLQGLVRFAIAISVLNILGHLWLGFEQSWITPIVALVAAYLTEIIAESVQSTVEGRKPRFIGTPGEFIAFLLPAHISALAVGMLVFAVEQLWIIAFGASIAVASKWIFKIPVATNNGKTGSRHFLNPSNFGITVVLLLFPSVGIAPPYMFTETVTGLGDWLLPMIVFVIGSFFNTKFTGRVPLITGWLIAFAAFATARSFYNNTDILTSLSPMTGFAFILFTFYMITDPATTPNKASHQVIFAVVVALLYALFMQIHVVYGIFYALTIVTILRAIAIYFFHLIGNRKENFLL
ncbi:MAG: enediyne biosynthesis protein UnbU [Pseudomonadota bacterium]